MPYASFEYGDPAIQNSTVVRGHLFGISVRGASDAPVWPMLTFAPGTLGQVYSQQFDLTPASAPTIYALVSGSLPPGLALANLGGDVGLISGVPSAAGSYSFTLRASNNYGMADQAFSIAVNAASGGAGGSFAWVA